MRSTRGPSHALGRPILDPASLSSPPVVAGNEATLLGSRFTALDQQAALDQQTPLSQFSQPRNRRTCFR